MSEPPAQTQQGLSEEEGPQCMAVTRNGHQCSRAPHEESDDYHEAEGAADNGGTLLWAETYPLEKQPSPAAAPAQLSEAWVIGRDAAVEHLRWIAAHETNSYIADVLRTNAIHVSALVPPAAPLVVPPEIEPALDEMLSKPPTGPGCGNIATWKPAAAVPEAGALREALNKLDGLRGCLQEMSARADVRMAKDFLSRAEALIEGALSSPSGDASK